LYIIHEMAGKKTTDFTQRVIRIIKSIPFGRVATYGQVAHLAGNPRASRQVSWILASSSRKEKLPWHRVINSRGMISLPRGAGYEQQKMLLLEEGVKFGKEDRINLERFLWQTHLPSVNSKTNMP
jgi:methylated-DNA-protein-cysteine methyltransferase-like protein